MRFCDTKLENTITKMRETMTEEEIIRHIKNSKAAIFAKRKHYPFGVFVYDNSPAGGVMVGRNYIKKG